MFGPHPVDGRRGVRPPSMEPRRRGIPGGGFLLHRRRVGILLRSLIMLYQDGYNDLASDLPAAPTPIYRSIKASTASPRESLKEKKPKMAAMKPLSELVRALGDEDYFKRQSAAWRLVEAGGEAVAPLLAALGGDPDPQVRFKAAWALGKIGDERGLEPLARALLEDEDPAVREWAASALEAIGDPRAVPPLAQSLATDPSREVRLRSSLALGAFGAVEAFEDLLREGDLEARRMAVVGVGRLRSAGSMELFAPLSGDADPELRRRVAWSLGEMGASGALPLLLPALKDDGPVVRMEAAKALAKIGGEEACRMAASLLDDPDPRVRLSAVTSLGEIGLAEALDRLVEVLFGEDEEEIRAWAAWSLGEIDDIRAIEPLQEACVKCPPKVREKALDSLEEVFGMGRAAGKNGGGGDP